MRWKKISDAVVRRLPLYLRVLDDLARKEKVKLISSQELGELAGVSPALVRKDLAWFGEFGKQGVGYELEYLRHELRRILNLDVNHRVGLVGVGSLGSALTRYNIRRYRENPDFNLHIVALFDSSEDLIDTEVEGLRVQPLDAMEQTVQDMGIEMAIITVPASDAQAVAERMVAAGVKAILNFAPITLHVADDVQVASADLTLELQRLAYYLVEE